MESGVTWGNKKKTQRKNYSNKIFKLFSFFLCVFDLPFLFIEKDIKRLCI